ncbi:MAG: host attachment protein [Rhodobacteraceae bacterium]|nr:host attachment protein [Paracoccaceae bacterium]
MEKLGLGTWVLVADGRKALFLRSISDKLKPELELVSKHEIDNPPDREHASAPPGKRSGGMGRKGSGVEERDLHGLAEERFAQDLAERLYKLSHRGELARLVIAAPPATLGVLRKAMHPAVAEAVSQEIAKTLTGHDLPSIEALLEADLAKT